MQITKIAPAVKTPGRYNIFLDEKYAFSLDEQQLVGLGLKKGAVLSAEEVERLQGESDFGKSYVRALDLVSRRLRSEREIRDYAWRKQWTPEARERVVERLRERGYLNDEKFAEAFVRSRANTRNFSKRKMMLELTKKGISKDTTEKVMSDPDDFDELESLKNLVAKKRARYDSDEKLIAYLARQGFRYDDIKRALDETE